jgi:integrase
MEKRKLTKGVVDSIAVSARGVIVWDTMIPGFAIKVSHTGKRTYFMKYRTKSGRQRKPNIGTHGAITCDQAREIAQTWAYLIAKGQDPLSEREAVKASPTMEQFCRRVIDEDAKQRLKPRSIEEAERLIKNVIIPRIGSLKVSEIERARIAKLHHELHATKPQANRVLSFLSKVFNLAERWGVRRDGSNPCRHIPRYPERPRDRFLSEEEIRRLMQTLDLAPFSTSPFALFVKLALLTGCRKSEILNLRWSEVDLNARVLRLADSKTGPRTCILNDMAAGLLRNAQPVAGQKYVIAGRSLDAPAVGVQKWWVRLRMTAGLTDVNIHALRHTHASLAAATGQSLPQIGALLGHSDPDTTFRYAHHYDASLRSSSNAVCERLIGILSATEGQPPTTPCLDANQSAHFGRELAEPDNTQYTDDHAESRNQ